MRSEIHVLHITENLRPFGGTPIKLLYQVQNSSPNFKFTICCITEKGELANKFKESGADVITLGRWKNYDLCQYYEIKRIIKERKIDIVHTHFARSKTYGRIAAIFSGKPMIVSEHGIPRNTSLPMYFFDSILNLLTSFNISNSNATLLSVKRTTRLNRKNMHVIYNGVKDAFTKSNVISNNELKQKHGYHPDDFIIVDVGSHTFWRDHITLIKAISSVRLNIPHLKVILIGDGPSHSSLVNAVKELRLENQIFFWGNIARDKIHRFIHCADIYVNPALEEGFGIATVEAMLCELPVICANSGSLPELIEPDKEGLLFEPKNEEELSQYILKLYHSKELRESLGNAARKRALEKFSVKQFVKAFEDKYLSMIK